MNTKTFAQTARRLLMDGVAQKLLYWGFTPEGEVVEEPIKVAGGYSFRGDVYDNANVPALWTKLKSAIRKKGIEVVVEEAAYTWFNRMMALRIMAKNDYEEPQLSYAEGMEHTPYILQRARQGEYSYLNVDEQTRLRLLISDYNKDPETFALLLVGYCHNHQMLNKVFGKLDDYTELLLPDNMLQENGFLHLLNTTDAISDDDYQKVELIGWLYQFYISERKDEVFASFKKNKKAEAKDIPAATQIFTPNWIVKYMVENTAGKLWLDKNPDSPLKENMKYLVENDSNVIASDREAISPLIKDIEELTLIDPACGSGHILVEGFDLLYQMYMEEYYTPEEAVESILTKNLYGLDIDDRAAQLATFAILLKAAQQYRDVLSKGWMPQVYAMPEAQDFAEQEVKDFLGDDGEEYWEELSKALLLMKQAKNLGSVMKLSLSADAHKYIETRLSSLQRNQSTDFNVAVVFQKIQAFIPVLLLLTKKYSSVVANPPYMVSGKMNSDLKDYLSEHYIKTKGDLCTVFMEAAFDLIITKGLYGMINQTSWMFKTSYYSYRVQISSTYHITSLLHLGPRVFDELSGEVVQSTSFIVKRLVSNLDKEGLYYDLTEPKTSEAKHGLFKNTKDKPYRFQFCDIIKIQDNIVAYWLSSKALYQISQSTLLSSIGDPKKGIASGDDSIFFRYWHEINNSAIKFDMSENFKVENYKWFPLNKGGGYRKWSGNFESVVDWENDGEKIKNFKNSAGKLKSRPQNLSFSFKKGITYNIISSKGFAGRMTDKPSMMSDVGPTIYNLENNKYVLGLLNSKIGGYYFKVLCPGYKYDTGAVGKFPVLISEYDVDYLVDENVTFSKKDWDSFETSWDFEKSPFLNETDNLISAFQKWQEKVTQDFFQLHANEEELNRIFIVIYGLQEELTPEVALKDITILQDELDRKALEALEPTFREQGKDAIELPIDKGEVISQFISYCIGAFMGRYRLDKEGLNIAHPNPTADELETYTYKNGEVEIDEDAILPLMGTNCNFPDDAVLRIHQLLDTIWGHEVRTENINFIQDCLNKDLDKFLVKDFYKYHCKMYKKKPIYWLFSSKNGAFQALVYMHRMNEFTAEKIRANYLLEHLKNLHSEEALLKSNESNLNTQEARRLEQLRKDIHECEIYDLELKNVADQQIKFDLDDGVTANYKLFETVVAKIK